MGAALRAIENGEEVGVHGRLAAGDLHHVRLPFVAHHGVDQALHVIERPVLLA